MDGVHGILLLSAHRPQVAGQSGAAAVNRRGPKSHSAGLSERLRCGAQMLRVNLLIIGDQPLQTRVTPYENPQLILKQTTH